MQIHELNTFSGELNEGVYLAVDNGADTTKIPVTEVVREADNAKLNTPTDIYDQPTYGTAGQILRTKGNGATEWANVGQPTDAQTAQAVSAWLDAHPEATTTVEDNSLTNKKLVLGTLNFVTPEMFGAVGDGVTDDASAIQSALDCGGTIVFSNGKTYKIAAALRVSNGTVLDLNGATILCSVLPSISNFKATDAFTAYNGNGNIVIKNGTIEGGTVSFIHGHDILIDNVSFLHTLGNHFLEICACNDFTIRDSSFIGMKHATGTREYINFDQCEYNSFPWLTDPSTYDNTVNKNITIRNCYFAPGTGDYTDMDDAIGQHYMPDTTVLHDNIVIENNIFDITCNYGIKLRGFKNSIVSGNRIMTPSSHAIQLGYGENNQILNNVSEVSSNSAMAIISGAGETNLTICGNTHSASGAILPSFVSGNFTGTFKKLQPTVVASTNARNITLAIPFTLINKLELSYGTVSSGGFGWATIQGFPGRGFEAGEIHHVYVLNSDATADENVTFTFDSTDTTLITATKAFRYIMASYQSFD